MKQTIGVKAANASSAASNAVVMKPNAIDQTLTRSNRIDMTPIASLRAIGVSKCCERATISLRIGRHGRTPRRRKTASTFREGHNGSWKG